MDNTTDPIMGKDFNSSKNKGDIKNIIITKGVGGTCPTCKTKMDYITGYMNVVGYTNDVYGSICHCPACRYDSLFSWIKTSKEFKLK